MPPVGILAIKQHLHKCGFAVEYFNVASQMLRYPGFNVEKFFENTPSDYLGVDLHWLVHSHGALELTKLYKEIHPSAKTVVGGIASTSSWGSQSKKYISFSAHKGQGKGDCSSPQAPPVAAAYSPHNRHTSHTRLPKHCIPLRKQRIPCNGRPSQSNHRLLAKHPRFSPLGIVMCMPSKEWLVRPRLHPTRH